jgi:hypothetical protein
MEILITESQLRNLLKEEYSEKIVQQLVDKFKQEDPNEDEKTIREYIKRFDKIKGSIRIADKDIFNYTLFNLRATLMSFYKGKGVKPKVDKSDDNLDLVYERDDIKVYRADTRQKCIKYGNGYSFCISSYSDSGSYKKYRIEESGTPYFLFNTSLDKRKYAENTYLDPEHLLVIIVYEIGGKYYDDNGNPHRHNLKDLSEYKDGHLFKNYEDMVRNVGHVYYSVSDAENMSEKYYLSFDSIEEDYFDTMGLENIIVPVGLHGKDSDIVKLEQEESAKFLELRRKYTKFFNGRFGTGFVDGCNVELQSFNMLSDLNRGFPNSLFSAVGKNQFYSYQVYHKSENGNKTSIFYRYGDDGYEECKEEVKDEIKRYLSNNIKKDESDYEIVKCEWPEGYGEYVKDAHRIATYLLHRKWTIEKE